VPLGPSRLPAVPVEHQLYRMLQMEHYKDRVRQAQQMAEARGLTQGKDFKFWSTQPVLKLGELRL
jgi:hypothetical protein